MSDRHTPWTQSGSILGLKEYSSIHYTITISPAPPLHRLRGREASYGTWDPLQGGHGAPQPDHGEWGAAVGACESLVDASEAQRGPQGAFLVGASTPENTRQVPLHALSSGHGGGTNPFLTRTSYVVRGHAGECSFSGSALLRVTNN